MLNYNFLNNYKNWGDGLDKIAHEMPWKAEDFRKSLNPNSMEAAIWLIEELKKVLPDYDIEHARCLSITVLNSWLGFPLVPLLCENLPVRKINLIDIDNDALELSKVFNRHYSNEGIDLNHVNWDVPFAFHDINALNTDVVISMCAETMYPLRELTTANPDCIFAIQNSNLIKEMYGINCIDSPEAHKDNSGVTDPIFLDKKVQKYWAFDGLTEFDRFMIIGKK